MRERMRLRHACTVLAIVVSGCERAPREDFAHSGGVEEGRPAPALDAALPRIVPPESPTQEVDVAPAGPCIKLTPDQAPPPVLPGPATGCPADPEPKSAKLAEVHVRFPDHEGLDVTAELARTERETMRGLMFRKAMTEDHGMLFDLRVRDDHKFWMHNTCIPLDLLFIDEDGTLVGIVENAPTLDDSSRGVGCPSRFVLEVNAGWSRRHAVKAGQHVNLPPTDLPSP
jgi:uncharacterized membrane protein (UPF0127 family)